MKVAQFPTSHIISNPTTIEAETCLCQVCGDKAHGVHFGVMACRACAAFYRRFIVLNLEYECLNDPRKCIVDNTRRSSCRHCRFQKCLKAGMTTDNVQFNRDVYSHGSERRRSKNNKMKSPSKIEENAIYPSTSVIALQEKLYRSSIFEECKNISIRSECERIFRSNYPNINEDFGNLNNLQKVAFGLEKLRAGQDLEDIKFDNRLSYDTLVPHWTNVSKQIAELVMHSWLFRNINSTEQLKVFKYVWKTLYRLERLQMTVQVFGEKCVDERKLIIDSKRAIQLDALFLDIEGVSKEKRRFTLNEYKKYADRLITEVAKPLCKLKLSTIEVAFMLCMVCQYNEQHYFENSVVPVADAFQNDISNNLHDYYTSIGITNYGSRIQQIIKCVTAMKKIHNDDFIGNLIEPPILDHKSTQQ
ncbi:unnamed protein product [Caenorhabditis angaria]|uniref:Nuclear receptor domain-containing protein n=1 Tax=Caenorhabditis angaria TaxID=860376 RepID=A0A9P1IWB2_9PELO|nr:unnamed protein product [Caenorhabditis angaria]